MGPTRPKWVILIGLRASGKTAVGRALAHDLDADFVDLDGLTPRRLGAATAAEALRSFGEPAFRRAEANALEELIRESRSGGVLALGGGTPTAPGAADILAALRRRGDASIVYLHAAPPVLRDRLAGSDPAQRPALTAAGTLAEVDALYAARDALYRGLADVVIDASGGDAASVVANIRRELGI